MARTLQPGDILYTGRAPHWHCGLFVGRVDGTDLVVHHAGKTTGLFDKGPVELTSLSDFARGREWWPQEMQVSQKERDSAVEWALWVAEQKCLDYNVLFSNCEHLATAAYGRPTSYQVNGITRGAASGGALGALVAGILGRTVILGGLITLGASTPVLVAGGVVGFVAGSALGLRVGQLRSLLGFASERSDADWLKSLWQFAEEDIEGGVT